MPLKFAVFL